MTGRLLRIALVALAVLVCLWLVVRWMRRPPDPAAAQQVLQGEIESTEVNVAAKIAARVQDLRVSRGQRVARNEVLLTLDSPEARAKLQEAQGARDAATALEDKARRGARVEEIAAARANWQRAVAGVEYAEKMFGRMDRLLKDGVVPAQRRDEAEAGLKSAKELEAAALAQLDMARKGAREEDKRAAAAQVERARGAIAGVEAALADTTLTAPRDGEVWATNVRPGELVGPGAPLVTIIDLSDIWATFQIREDRLGGLRVGDRFAGRVPALDHRELTWQVSYIAAQADFATWRSTSAQGGFDLKTFEVRATPTQAVDALRPGMSVIVPLTDGRLPGARR